ncbi:MAG: sodium:proton antiporter [Burkholderiales bacterium]
MPPRALPLLVACLLAPSPALAAESGAELGRLPIAWALPFAGLLVSIAVMPLVSQRFWHRHYGKFSLAWALAFVVPLAWRFGIEEAWHQVVHALLLEYVPFVVVLFALFTIAGGICIHGRLAGTPLRNTGLLAGGATLASLMGTTGASMLLIRPLLAGNEGRAHRVHVVVFFILLVGNVGGALTPLGDPPLFIGYLKGVDFFWPTRELLVPTVSLCAALLAIFYAVDTHYARREPAHGDAEVVKGPFRIEGGINFLLLAGVVGAVLMSGMWKTDVTFTVFGTTLRLQGVARECLLVLLALASLWLTPRAVREHNAFHWEPIVEVAKLFAGIFVTIVPLIAMLQAGREGALAPVLELIAGESGQPGNMAIYWATGLFSAFLDNAPTYLVFFNLAGGDAATLMGPRSATLAAISMGAVYFGALTYIGNAPNFMIKAIAEDRGVRMPSFFAFLAISALLLGTLVAIVGYLMFA